MKPHPGLYLTFVTAFGLSACSISVAFGIEEGQAAAPTATYDPVAATSAANGLDATYVHPTMRYAFDYPSVWSVHEVGDGAVVLGSIPFDTTAGIPMPDGEIKIDFYPSTSTTLDEMAAGVRRGAAMGSFQILWEEFLTLPSGLEAVRYEIGGTGPPVVLHTVANGYGLTANGFGDVTRFDAIVMTLRAAPW